MKNAINRALAAKKNYSKYICLFLMLLGTCVHAWAAESSVATFNSATVVTNSGYGSSYGYYSSDWDLSMGGGGDKAGFNAGVNASDKYIPNAYGTGASTSHHGFYIRSKNKLDDVCKITFTYTFCSVVEQCNNAKIYLAYSTDGSSWSPITIISGSSQGTGVPPSNTSGGWEGYPGYNETVWTFEFSKIASAYYAIVISRNGTCPSDKGFNFTNTQIDFRKGCCDNIVTPAKGTMSHCDISFSPSEVATCSSTASERQLTVTVTPASCYAAPTADAVARASGVACTKVSGPSDNGDGSYNYVFQFAQNVSGTTTFNASIANKQTYAVSYAAGTTTSTGGNTIYGSHADDTKTCDVNLTLPGSTFTASGYTQDGWSTSSGGSKTYNLSGYYTIDAPATLYPHWSANTISLTLDKNGGDADGSASIKYNATALTDAISHATRAGYAIEGYYAEPGCTNKVLTNTGALVNYTGYVSGGKWVRATTPTTLYAKWTQTYTLAVANVDNVVISATSPSVAEGSSTGVTGGTTVTLSHGDVESPKSWAGWNVYKTGDESTKVTVTTNTFTMPSYDVTVSAYLFGDLRAFCEPPLDATLVHKDAATDDSPLKITSAAGQKVKAIRLLTLTVTGASGTKDVTLSGTDLLFYKTDGTQITGSVLQTTSGSLAATDIVVAYAPSAYVDENFATPSITVTCDGNTKTFNGLVTGRCLPDEFVIAAKAGSEWVALTAKITGSGTQDAMPIRVDNTTTPTKASVAMNTSEYQLLGLPTTNSRYASNGVAVHLYSTQSTKVLNASTSSTTKTHINTNATHANAATSDNCLYYEWKLISSDLVHYTVTNSNENASLVNNLVLGYSTESGKWGMYTSDKANQDIFLLPITEVLTDMDVEVMEWGTSSMVLRFAETPPSSTIKVTLGGSTSAAKTLTNINSGNTSDLYKVEGLSLTGNNCEVMQITDGSDATKGALIRKPILVNSTSAVGSDYRTALTDEVCASCDIVILNGGKLTADQDKDDHTSFANIYVYPGGKLVLDGYSLGAKQQVYARGGYSWLNLSTYALPELYIKGTIKFNGSAKIIYDYYIQNYKYYQFCLPYTVALNKVTDEADVADFPAWIKHYDGSLRAANSSATSWAWYNGTNFEAGVGYIVAAKPRQVTAVKERPLSIIRFPLTNNAFSGTSTADYGEAQKSVTTTAHGIAGYNANPRTVTANNVGWNFVGNPYMATWKGDIGHNQLVENKPDGTHWDGSYKWVDAATKYITVMSAESGHDYEQYVASNTELKPFFPFYFQETASGGSGTLTFTLGNRIKKAPTRMRTPELREAFVQIDIERNSSTDQTGFLISDKYSNDIDFDDMEKQFGSSTSTPKVWLMHDDMRMAFEAMTEIRAAGFTPLGYRAPENGDYVLSINSGSNLDDVAAVYLNDNVENVQNYNLLEDAYEFSSDAAVYNDTRFTVRIVMKENTATGLDELQGTDLDKPQKFLHEGRMYIIYKGFIWDATGKKVKEINK